MTTINLCVIEYDISVTCPSRSRGLWFRNRNSFDLSTAMLFSNKGTLGLSQMGTNVIILRSSLRRKFQSGSHANMTDLTWKQRTFIMNWNDFIQTAIPVVAQCCNLSYLLYLISVNSYHHNTNRLWISIYFRQPRPCNLQNSPYHVTKWTHFIYT